MTTKIYPHLTVIVDTEPWFQDLFSGYGDADHAQRRLLREKMSERDRSFSQWLIAHGYEYGRDYQRCDQGFQFATPALATMFALGARP